MATSIRKISVQDVGAFLDAYAPSHLAENWDNVGLLVGDASQEIARVMTCLTVTPESLDEAIQERVNLIVTHHPLPFQPVKRVTADTTPGRLLLDAIRHGIAIYSPHTAFDSALDGINQWLASGIGLTGIEPLRASANQSAIGTGRCGTPVRAGTLADLATEIKRFLQVGQLQIVGSLEMPLQKIAVGCGSAGSFLEDAKRSGCNVFVTGETSFHTCLEARASKIGLILTGHYASERFAVERLAEILARQFPELQVWASRMESDPIQSV